MTFDQISAVFITFGFAALALALLVFIIRRSGKGSQSERLDALITAHNEMVGRLKEMQESAGKQQSLLNERLDGVGQRVNQSLAESTGKTQENLVKLQERLAVIDTAQNNIQNLAQDVIGLRAILQNKQTRGAFGQNQMEMIIQDGLPQGHYEFQATLSNGSRPDCIVKMPNKSPALVIDAKFPLEAWNRMRDSETVENSESGADSELRKEAVKSFRADLKRHINDIAEKYLIAGETNDTALLFIPSESIFAEIHENFSEITQHAYQSRIVIVSPTHLLLSVRVIQALLKDFKMREQAHRIQDQVAKFMKDLKLLGERIGKLKTHNDQTTKDIEMILTSTRKLNRHGENIDALQFDESEKSPDSPAPPPPNPPLERAQ